MNNTTKVTNPNPNTFPKNNLIPEQSPYTIVHSYAIRLRANQDKNENPIVISNPKITTRQSLPAVIFKKEDFMVKLVAGCKFTLVGKFFNTMPKFELIRKSFIQQAQLTGGVNITRFNARHIYIDLANEEDHISIWNKQNMYIEGQLMRLQVRTPTFTPKKETPIVPIWVTLPELPCHCYNKEFLLLSYILLETLYLDAASL